MALYAWHHHAGGLCPDVAPYGPDPERNLVGLFEKVGPDRYRWTWRWAPEPGFDLDVLELVPQ